MIGFRLGETEYFSQDRGRRGFCREKSNSPFERNGKVAASAKLQISFRLLVVAKR
jgi:hypothetical protein